MLLMSVALMWVLFVLILAAFIDPFSSINTVYKGASFRAVNHYSVEFINYTSPPYNETHEAGDLASLIAKALAIHGIYNYSLIVMLGNFDYYALLAVHAHGNISNIGILIRGDNAELDAGLREVVIREGTAREGFSRGDTTFVVTERYVIYDLTSPTLSKYFPGAEFFGGYENQTISFYVAGVLTSSTIAYGTFIGEYGEWVELESVNNEYRTFVPWTINCANTDNSDHSPEYQQALTIYDGADSSFYEWLSCPSSLETWWVMQALWSVNSIAQISNNTYYNKGPAICGTCPAPP
ncbi:hypothetical protein [Thermocladium modestius]|nr:hypothetical protein [Thermocladium modestius]